MEISTNLKVLLIAGCSVFLLGITSCSMITGWYNDAVSLEESTKAQFSDNKNRYDNFWKKVKEVAQVPDQYKEAFKEVLVAETSAKYGAEGSKAVFQWFQDRQINFDASQYRKVQDVIESGREDFKRSQTELLDKQRKYSVHLKGFWGRFAAGFFDMPSQLSGELAPKKDLDGDGKLTALDYPIVTSTRTNEAFKSGEDNEPVNVFGEHSSP